MKFIIHCSNQPMCIGTRQNINDSFLLLLLFILYPFAGLLYSIVCLSLKKHSVLAFSLILIFAFFYGYTYRPATTDDLVTHNYIFSQLKNARSFTEFMIFETANEKPDILLDWIYWIVGKIIEQHQIVGGIGATIYYGCMLLIIFNWLSYFKTPNYQKAFLLLLFMFLTMSPPAEFSGMRQGNANLIFLMIITWPNLDRKKRLILLLIPPIVHFSMLPITLLYYISSIVSRKNNIIISFFLIGLTLLFIPLVREFAGVLESLGSIGSGIASKINTYTSAESLHGTTPLYAGSRIRFYLQIALLILSPYILKKIISKPIPSALRNYFNFSIIFLGYIIFTSQTHVLARTLMLFKFMICLDIIYTILTTIIQPNIRKFMQYIALIISISGIVCILQAREYKVMNDSLINSTIYGIIKTKTELAGYEFN